jgi:hypothetical protein
MVRLPDSDDDRHVEVGVGHVDDAHPAPGQVACNQHGYSFWHDFFLYQTPRNDIFYFE